MNIPFEIKTVFVAILVILVYFFILYLKKKTEKEGDKTVFKSPSIQEKETIAKTLNLKAQTGNKGTTYSGTYKERRVELVWGNIWLQVLLYFKKGYRIPSKVSIFDYLKTSPEPQSIFKSFNERYDEIVTISDGEPVETTDQIGIAYFFAEKTNNGIAEIRSKMEMLSQICDSLERDFKA